jgi:hypothetical protein
MERYSKGEMPHWFDPRWLDIEEAPPNTWWRQQGLRPLQVDATWLGDGGGEWCTQAEVLQVQEHAGGAPATCGVTYCWSCSCRGCIGLFKAS